MRARPLIAVGLLLFCAALVVPRPAHAAPENTWYAQRVTRGDVPLRVEHLWSSGPKLRAETVLAGRPLLTIVNGPLYYVIDRLTARGVAIERSPAARAADATGVRPFGHDADVLIAAGGEAVRTERVGRRRADVLRLTNQSGRREVWVTRDDEKLPIRVETFDRASSKTVVTDYVDWTRGLTIPDRFFEPDPRFEIERITYAEYTARSAREPVGPAPVFFSTLLHGPEAARDGGS